MGAERPGRGGIFAPATIAHLVTGRMDEDGFYRVTWLRNGREVAQHGFDDLLQARNFAKDRLRIQKVRKGVDRVCVIDVDGVPYFEYKI
jgi:hypothetical protein